MIMFKIEIVIGCGIVGVDFCCNVCNLFVVDFINSVIICFFCDSVIV